jgi:hypothetical protein
MRFKSAAIGSSTLAVAILGFAVPARLQAQFGVAARASTLGLGAELSYRPSDRVGVRGGFNYFQLTRESDVQGIAYRVTPHLENGTVILDFFPLGGSFHLSGGLLFNHNEGRLVARLTEDVVIGNDTYTPSQVGSLTGIVDFKKTAPYAGIGFSGQGRVSFLFDLGVGFTGTPRANLTGTTNLTGQAKAQFDADILSEQVQLRADIADKSYLKYHPVLSLGLKIGL